MSSENPTQEELVQGYRLCKCGGGVELLQAGFEVPLYHCKKCDRFMAYKDDFFKLAAEILSK